MTIEEGNRKLRIKSPAGQRDALDAIAKLAAERKARQSVKAPAKQQVRVVELNKPAIVTAVADVRAKVGSLLSVAVVVQSKANKRVLAICDMLQRIEAALSQK